MNTRIFFNIVFASLLLLSSSSSVLANSYSVQDTISHLLQPPNKAVLSCVPGMVSLRWTSIEGSLVAYRLQVSRDSVFASLLYEDITFDTSYVLKVGDATDTLYWRIKTEFPGDEVHSFSFSPAKGFSSASPKDNDTITTHDVTLMWTKDPCAIKYEVHHQSRLGAKQDTLTDTVIVLKNLSNKESYVWKVRGFYESGMGDWTLDRTFYYQTIANVYENLNADNAFVMRELDAHTIEITSSIVDMSSAVLSFYDMMGQQLSLPYSISANRIVIDTKSLARGIYLIKVNGNKNFSRLLMIE